MQKVSEEIIDDQIIILLLCFGIAENRVGHRRVSLRIKYSLIAYVRAGLKPTAPVKLLVRCIGNSFWAHTNIRKSVRQINLPPLPTWALPLEVIELTSNDRLEKPFQGDQTAKMLRRVAGGLFFESQNHANCFRHLALPNLKTSKFVQ